MNKTAFVLFGHIFGFIEKILPQCGSEFVDGHLLPAIPTRCHARFMVVAIACVALSVPVFALTVPATWNSPTDVPVSAANYAASGNSLQLSLNCIPATGELLVIRNTGPAFIEGTFSNLSQGQAVDLSFDGTTYHFIANYYGGSGNDLVLVWAGARAFAWGYNRFGQLGDNSTTQRNAPAAVFATGSNVLSGKTVVSAAAGSGHSLAICSDGMVAAWGFNYDGELGNGGTAQSKFPVAVDMTSGVSSLSGKAVISVAAGASHSVALCSDGSVSAWGYNFNGELGDGSDMDSLVPVAVDTTPGVSALAGKSVTALAAGEAHTLALCSDGTIAAWGWNGEGELGDNDLANSQVPVAVSRSGGSALAGKTAVAVAAGISHSLALCSDGTVVAWGDNTYGQLGNNSTSGSLVPMAVNTASGVSALFGKSVTAIAAGGYHSLAICSDGTVVAWGSNWYGELGDGSSINRLSPVTVNATGGDSALIGRTVVGITAGEDHSAAKCSDGTIVTWGWNGSGQLGDATTAQRLNPVNVGTTSLGVGERFAMVVGGCASSHTLALVASSPQPFPVISVEPQGENPLSNGLGSTDFGSSLTENPLSRTFLIRNIGTTILTGLAITQNGEHTGDYEVTSQPALTLAPGRSTAFSVRFTPHAGGSRTAALHIASNDPLNPSFTANLIGTGTVTGALAAVFNTPVDVPLTTPYYTASGQTVDITLNCAPACAELMVVRNTGPDVIRGRFSNLMQGQMVTLSHSGQNYDFVANYFGGNGNDLVLVWAGSRVFRWGAYASWTPSPVDTSGGVLEGKTVISVASGSNYILATNSDGRVAAWGVNAQGQLGDNSITPRTAPIAVNTDPGLSALAGKYVTAVAAGNTHSLALCSDGKVVSWGYNSVGQLGDNSTIQRNSPVFVDDSPASALNNKTVVAISAGESQSLALCSDGTIAAWGGNGSGQLGDNTTTNRLLPVAVNAAPGSALHGKTVVSISAGVNHSHALCSDGTVVGWGYNGYGELGDGTTIRKLVPVVASNASGVSALAGKTVTAVAAGQYHCMALCSDGNVVTWGYNSNGQLGDGTNATRLVPVNVDASSSSALFGKDVTGISAGSSHCMALCSDGTAVSWGNNSLGQLGDNTNGNKNLPVAIANTPYSTGGRLLRLVGGVYSAQSSALVGLQGQSSGTLLPVSDINIYGIEATLNGIARAGGGFNAPVSFEYGLTEEYGYSVSGNPAVAYGAGDTLVSARLTNLVPGALYHYRVTVAGIHSDDATFVPVISSNANLDRLMVEGADLSPAFESNATNYTTHVPLGCSDIKVVPFVSQVGASIQVNGEAVLSGQYSQSTPLAIGTNMVNITVTAMDGTTTKTYTVVVDRAASAESVTVGWHAVDDIPVTASSYSALGNLLDLTLHCEPLANELMVIKNTGNDFIHGEFSNLAQGQQVTLPYNGNTYNFVADYYGGTGNDLVLKWAATRVFYWGGGKTSPMPITFPNTNILYGRSVLAIAAGDGHNLALCSDGVIAAWGYNFNGELGDGTTTDISPYTKPYPVAVNTEEGLSSLHGKRVVAISSGDYFSLALCADGTVMAWGKNNSGQLGDGTITNRLYPVAVNTAPESALFGKRVVAISAGGSHSLALCSDGTLVGWGSDFYGAIGDGMSRINQLIPVSTSKRMGTSALYGKSVVAVSAGAHHSLALCSDGTVAAWGIGGNGRLGNNATGEVYEPDAVFIGSTSALKDKTVIAVSAGGEHSLALCNDGSMAAWGGNVFGQVGNNMVTTSVLIPMSVVQTGFLLGKPVSSIGAGDNHSLAVCSNGTAVTWGWNGHGQLGLGTNIDYSATPVTALNTFLTNDERFTAISGGVHYSHTTLAIVSSSTRPPLPTCVTNAVSNLTLTTVQLNGLVNGQGYDTIATFSYGTNGITFPNQIVAPATINGTGDAVVNVQVGGLQKGTTYYYRVIAASKGGITTSETASFITRTEPTCEVGIATTAGTTSTLVSGSANAHGSDTEVFVDYGTDAANLTHSIRAAPTVVIGYEPTPVSVVLQNLLQSTTYYYRFRGQSVAGTGASISDSFQMATLSGVARVFPGPPPDADGFVFVSLLPPGLASGWRFVGEQQWRVPGIPVGGLATGDYDVEFKPLAGYIQPPRETISVFSGQAATLAERIYYESVDAGSGGLTVILKPDDLADPGVPEVQRAQWRLLGEDETQWKDSGDEIDSLLPGNYLVECKPVVGRATPPPASIEVVSDQNALLTVTYRLADPPVGLSPTLVPFETVSLDSSKPYGFVGQIRSNVGSSSGFLIKPRVVATAGHVVFDDGTLSAVTGLQWLHQRHRGTHEPAPKTPRGYYVFDGYAAQRAVENTPGSSSPQSQHLDAAAIYFLEDVGRGGASGYLASDLDDNEFLLSASDKILAGYPVDGIPSSNQGRMHATSPMNALFARGYGRTFTSSDIRGAGGMSGGPLCVRHNNGNYYPTAIYLGGSGQSVVRAIDSGVIDLFNRAEISGNGGDNQTGGGITHTSVSSIGTTSAPGVLKVTIQPASARNAGAGWKLNPESYYRLSGAQKSGLNAGTYTLQLKSVEGFETPESQPISINGGQLKEVTFTYADENNPPNISAIANRSIDEDDSTGLIGFTIADPDDSLASLELSGSTSNALLVPESNIVLGGTAANRTVLVTPASNQSGSAVITISVSDGSLSVTERFTLTVNPINDAPTITGIADQSIAANSVTDSLLFTIDDVETPAASLTLGKTSSNTSLVPPANIVLGGSGSNRTVTVMPFTGQLGSANISVTVSDGALTATHSFLLTVTGTALETWRFSKFGTSDNTGASNDSADPDGDGQTNLDEYAAGTDPNNGSDVFRVLSATKSALGFVVTASGKTGRSYELQRSEALDSGGWLKVGESTALSADVIVSLSDTSPPAGKAFYRVVVRMP